jgi:hypothetical protein
VLIIASSAACEAACTWSFAPPAAAANRRKVGRLVGRIVNRAS